MDGCRAISSVAGVLVSGTDLPDNGGEVWLQNSTGGEVIRAIYDDKGVRSAADGSLPSS